MEQGLGRNTTDIQAGATMGSALFDDGHFHAELGRADGADIAAGAGADYSEIKLFCHNVSSKLKCCGHLKHPGRFR